MSKNRILSRGKKGQTLAATTKNSSQLNIFPDGGITQGICIQQKESSLVKGEDYCRRPQKDKMDQSQKSKELLSQLSLFESDCHNLEMRQLSFEFDGGLEGILEVYKPIVQSYSNLLSLPFLNDAQEDLLERILLLSTRDVLLNSLLSKVDGTIPLEDETTFEKDIRAKLKEYFFKEYFVEHSTSCGLSLDFQTQAKAKIGEEQYQAWRERVMN